MNYTILKKHQSFGGVTLFCEHDSKTTKTKMKFSVFLPTEIQEIENAIIWLSGLTCNEENFITKAGVQACLAGTKTMIICPDTSPRGLDLEGESESYDFGLGAGFYVNATQAPYNENYQMYDYIVKDIVSLLKNDFRVGKISIMGHSMGGHGALIMGLKEKDLFESISAFSPIVNPVKAPWGQKAFKGYLGESSEAWMNYDATELMKNGLKHKRPILIDQGSADDFLEKELLSENFKEACSLAGQELTLRYQKNYDHSYYFISTFIEDHIQFHLKNF